MSEPEATPEEEVGPRYTKDMYTQEQWDALIQEETQKWNDLKLSLNQMQFSGSELFIMQAQLKAITNAIIEGDLTEENLNLHVSMIMLDSMQTIREAIEPQIREARLAALQQQLTPKLQMPWEKPNGGSQR
jgi:hypothetical protein